MSDYFADLAEELKTWRGLVRSGTPQDTIHRWDCRRLGQRVLQWKWAEGKSDAEIRSSAVNGLKFCKYCDPLNDKAATS